VRKIRSRTGAVIYADTARTTTAARTLIAGRPELVEFQEQLASKDAEVAKKTEALRKEQEELATAR
jgi:hypothetical protein